MQSLSPYLDCLGLTGPRRILNDFFGLRRVPDGETLSLRAHMNRVRWSHLLHLNVIRIGFDGLIGPDRASAERELDLVVHRTRQVYDQIQLGIARVQHWEVPAALAGGLDNISGDGEADDLCGRFSVDNNGIDGFFVLTYSGNRVGSSRSPGSCDKDGKSSGVVCEIGQGNSELTVTAFAHELGHYLGVAGHSSDTNNLMFSGQNGRQISPTQAYYMLQHCLITECSDLP